MTSQFRNEAWLDLQEVHSSLNYLKEKLDKTGRKIDATSSSGPIQFNFPGLPTRSTDVYNGDRRAAACFDAAALSTGDKRHRGSLQNAKRRDFHSGESPKRRGSCDGQRTFVKPVCINKEMLSWDAFHRLPSRHDHCASASSAFALGDDKDRFQVNSSLRPSGHVRYRAGERVPNDGALPGYENGTLSGATDKLRRVIERQRRAAERRALRKVHAPLECDPVHRDSSRPRPRLDMPAAAPPPRSEHVDSEHVAIPLKIPENLVTAVPRKIHHAAPMIFPSAAADLPMPQVEEDASARRLRSAVPDEDYVDDYLEFLRMRIEEKETESAEKPSQIVAAVPRSVADAPRVLADVPRFFADASRVAGDGWSLEEARCIDQEADGRVEQLVWKRKVVTMPPPKEYRGFSLVGGSPRARKKKQQQRAVAPKQSAPVVASSNPAADAKSTTDAALEKDLARPAKKSAITPTSWKEGRDLALKKHGPVPSDADSKLPQHQTSKPSEDDVDSSEGTASRLQGPSLEQNHATEPPRTISGLSAQARAQSVKRKAQLQAEMVERPSPAPKVRHYDAPAVREFIAKQRRSRQDDRRREQLGTAQVVRAKEERLEKLYALQRRTARVSAQRGRQKSREQQEEQAFVEQFAERLKSIPVRNGAASQPWCEADDDALGDDDSSPSDVASSNIGDAAVRANSSTKPPPRRDQEVQVSRQCSVEKDDRQPVEKPDSRPNIGVYSDHESGGSSECPSRLFDFHLQKVSEKGSRYEPTEQVRNLGRLAVSINNMIDEQMLRMGIPNLPEVSPQQGGQNDEDLPARLRRLVSAFDVADLDAVVAEHSQDAAGGGTSSNSEICGVEEADAAEMARNFFRAHVEELKKGQAAKGRSDSEEDRSKAPREVVESRDVSMYDKAVSAPSFNALRLFTLDEEPSHHLMPDPNNIASAWRKKNVKAFLTSTRLGGDSMLPSFGGSADLPLSPLKTLREAKPSQRISEGTSGELRTSLLLEDSTAHGATRKSHRDSAGRQGDVHRTMTTGPPAETMTAAQSQESEATHLTPPSVGMESAKTSQEGDVMPSTPASRDVSRGSVQEEKKSGLVSSSAALPPLGAVGGACVPAVAAPRKVNLDDDRAWILLEAQAKAALASAETARQLVQDRGPSMMERRSEDLARLLTAGTVAAASALAASLATRGFGSYVHPSQNAEEKRPAAEDTLDGKPHTLSSASSTTAPGITDEGSFESDDEKTSTTRRTTTEESRSPPLTKDGADGGSGAPDAPPTELDNSKDGALSESVSEELGALGLSDSSTDKRKEKPPTPSKKRQPKNLVPLSADSSATEDSTGARMWSQSSAFDPLLLDKDLLSCSLTERQSVPGREGDGAERPLALLRLQERDLVERARAELAWLEVLKRKCRERGSEDRMPALRKKQRGILIRLHQKRAELKALQARHLSEPPLQSKASLDASSVPTRSVTEVPSESFVSEPVEASSFLSDHGTDPTGEVSSKLEESEEVESKTLLPSSHASALESGSVLELPEDSTHLKLNASKRLLEERQQELQGRRKNVQELLDWQKRLNAEEASVRALERRALARLRARAAKAPQGRTESVSVTPPPSNPPDTTSKQSDEGKGSETVDAASTEEDIAEDTAATAPVTVTESVPEEEMDEQTSGDQQGTSTIESQVVASGSSFEAEVQTETTTKRSSSSRRSSPRSHDRSPSRALSSGRTAAALLLKRPLVPRMRGPKDSGSGSEDSFNVSLSETASDQSDIEVRILALSEELKKRQLEAVQLRKEQRRRRTEFLREKEESLKRHIEVYDTLIQRAKEELEKELDLAQHDKSVCVKPQIKKPRAAEQRKHRIPQLTPDSSLPVPSLVPQAKPSKPKAESSQETSSNSSSTKAVSGGEVPTEVPSFEYIDAASSIEERSHDYTASVVEDNSKAAVSEEISERVSEEIQEASFQEEESLRGEATDTSASSAQGTSTKTLSAKERGVSVRSEKSDEVSEDAGSEGVPSSANKTDASSSHRTEPPLSAKDLNESSVEDTPKSSLDAMEEDVQSSTAAHESSIKDTEASMIAAENTTAPVTTREAEAEEQLEDDFDAVESFAEYSEEIVRSTFLDDSRKRVVEDDADQEEQVEMAVESIWSCLLDDTAHVFREALLGTKDNQEARQRKVAQKEGDGENASRQFGGSTEKTESERKVSLGDFDEEKAVLVSQCSEDGGAPAGEATETAKQGDQWDGSELNSIAEKLVSDAIRCILTVAREKGMLATGEVSRVSDVSRKVSVILASIEEKRNSREMRKPQDHMVLATDLDEDEVAWKDASTVFLALDRESPPEKSGKELCSRAVQAEDCFLSTTSEQDWFDDDFGLGSGDQVFAYQRCIPNKPPPPYSPPKGGLASRMLQEPPWSVPRTEADIAAVVRKAAALVYEAAALGEDVEALRCDAGDLDENVPASGASSESGIEAESRRCYAEFLFDLTKELAQDMFCIGPSEVSPPWQRGVRLRRRRPLPASQDDFVVALEKRVLSERGFGRGDTGTSKWDASRGANFVDALLHREVCEEEPEWVDYSREEVAVKDQVADAIFLLLVDDTLEELKSLWNGAR
ncbi:centrosome-associated protein 350 [Ixodes scapularis]